MILVEPQQREWLYIGYGPSMQVFVYSETSAHSKGITQALTFDHIPARQLVHLQNGMFCLVNHA